MVTMIEKLNCTVFPSARPTTPLPPGSDTPFLIFLLQLGSLPLLMSSTIYVKLRTLPLTYRCVSSISHLMVLQIYCVLPGSPILLFLFKCPGPIVHLLVFWSSCLPRAPVLLLTSCCFYCHALLVCQCCCSTRGAPVLLRPPSCFSVLAVRVLQSYCSPFGPPAYCSPPVAPNLLLTFSFSNPITPVLPV